MSIETVLPIDRDSITQLSARKNEPQWMQDLRLNALESAGTLDLPRLEKTRIDRWKLNALGSHKQPELANHFNQLPQVVQDLLQDEGDSANVVVQRNSGIALRTVSEQLTKQGVVFTDLESALQSHGDLVQKHFMSVVGVEENRLTALHAAMWNGGVFVYVPRGVHVELPLQALYYSDDAEAAFAPHVLIVAEANSSVTYVDNYLSADGLELVHNGIVEVIVKAGAKVTFASIHNLGAGSTDITYRRSTLDNDSKIEWIIGELNSGNAMADTTSILKGNGSNSDAKVISVGRGDQKLNQTTRAIHFGKSTPSQMITRAVMKEEATAIINGVTKIEKGATGANGQQTERVLMLSPRARGDANPILLIDEDDVKAGHAASVGQVNPDQIYYLMSRGVPKVEAERLIIYGFLAPVISQVPIEKVRKQLEALVERKLG